MHSRPWLWPNLLSLDAPLVALLWQVLFVRCFHGSLGLLPAALLAVAVWIIYVADRTLDAWRETPGTPRHEFYRRYWRTVLPVWIAALAAGGWLAWSRLPGPLFVEGAAVASGTALYLAAVHLAPGLLRRSGSKESAVAVLFWNGSPGKHGRLRFGYRPTRAVHTFHEHVPARLVDGSDLVHAIL